VFVTDGTTSGAFGGVAGGDAICAAEASDAGLGGAFVAWLSVYDGNNPSTVHARDRLVTDAGWYLPGAGNTLVWSGPNEIAAGNPPPVSVNRNARGLVVGNGTIAWTGTEPDGGATGSDCTGWTVAGTTPGTGGRIGVTSGTWTNYANTLCSSMNHLYCFQK
jgi:hypothetical protein